MRAALSKVFIFLGRKGEGVGLGSQSTISLETGDQTHWQGEPLRAPVHARHVQIGTEHGNLSVLALVRFQSFEETLGIMEHGRTGFKGQRAILVTHSEIQCRVP